MATLAALGGAATVATVALPVATKVGGEIGRVGKSPWVSLGFGILMTLNPLNPLNWIVLLIIAAIIYFTNPSFLRNYTDPTTGVSRVTFGRAFLIALIPYFIIGVIIYSLLANSIFRLLSFL